MGAPGGGPAPAAPMVPGPVVAPLTNIQVTDPVTGAVVLGTDPNNVALGGATITNAAGIVTIMATADQTNEYNGGPVLGNQYNVAATQGNFANVQFLNNTPYLYRFR
jgi:hypothetical protein